MGEITPVGTYANSSLQAIKLAEALQGLAVATISNEFATERTEDLNLMNLTWDKFVSDLSKADEEGTVNELNDKLIANVLQPLIQQELAAAQEQEGQAQ